MSRFQPKAILFDLDGTLLDTAPDLGAALNAVLAQEQRELVPADAFTPIASHGANGMLKLGFGDDFEPHRDRLREAFLNAYQRDIAKQTRLYDGIERMLVALDNAGIAVAIVTNKPGYLTAMLLPSYPALSAIDVVVSGDTLPVAKPDPAPLLLAAEQLGIDPAACWYVGDAERDIQAGRRAGMFTILAHYGYIHTDDEPHLWQADSVIHAPDELLKLLK